MYLGCNLFVENSENTDMEYEIDSKKAYKNLENRNTVF